VGEEFPLAVFFIVMPGGLAGPQESSSFVNASFLLELYEQRRIRLSGDNIYRSWFDKQ
jgi:hypothetical protein